MMMKNRVQGNNNNTGSNRATAISTYCTTCNGGQHTCSSSSRSSFYYYCSKSRYNGVDDDCQQERHEQQQQQYKPLVRRPSSSSIITTTASSSSSTPPSPPYRNHWCRRRRRSYSAHRQQQRQLLLVIFSAVIHQAGLMTLLSMTNFISQAECHVGFSLSEEKRLIKQLIDNYTIDGKFGRPIKAMNATLRVGYGLSLVQIMDVDEKDQVLTTNVWCKYSWRDESLHWEPSDHENITIVRVPINTIWKPDFVLYNYADERLAEHRSAMALIYPNGDVTYIPTAIFKSTCFVDTTYFPFDEQSCHLKFGSWTYNGNALDPFFIDGKEYIELSEYVPSQEWIILEHSAKKNVAFYECCPNEPYPDLTFYLKLRRRATFYSYTLILPCVLLSFITMVLFMLPPETPAKMLLGINIFVAFFMLLLLLKESTPPTAKQIPIIGAYYCFNMVMTTVSTFLCSILVDMHYRADKRNPPGRWLLFLIIEVIARSMFIYVPPSMQALLDAQRRTAEIIRKRRRSFALIKRQMTQMCDCVVVKVPMTTTADGKRLQQCSNLLCGNFEDEAAPTTDRHLDRRSSQYRYQTAIKKAKNAYCAPGANRAAVVSNFCNEICQVENDDPESILRCGDEGELTSTSGGGGVGGVGIEVISPSGHHHRLVPAADGGFTSDSSSGQSAELLAPTSGGADGVSNYLSIVNKSLLSSRQHVPLVLSSATYSPIKRGVFVGATKDDRPQQKPSANDLASNEYYDYEYQRQRQKYADRENKSTNKTSKHHSSKSGTKHGKAPKRSFFPSSSFDLKHYNKFNTSQSPPMSFKMDPILRHLEEQVDLLGQAALAMSPVPMKTSITPRQRRRAGADGDDKKNKDKNNEQGPRGSDNSGTTEAAPPSPASTGVAVARASTKPTIESEIRLIRALLSKFILRIAEKELRKRNAEAWRMISMVLDRVFLFGYIISMILSLTSLFPQRKDDLPDGPRFPNGTLINDVVMAATALSMSA